VLERVVSRYDLFRKRIAPIAFAVAIALLVRETCSKQTRTHATVVLDFGSAASRVASVDVQLRLASGGEPINTFHANRLEGIGIGKPQFEVVMAEDEGTLHLDIGLVDGRHRELDRGLHLVEGALVRLPLERELTP